MTSTARREQKEKCVGRETELALLRETYRKASEGGERLVLVRGATGVGKSWLMAEFRRQMRLAGAVVLEGRCSPSGPPLAPLSGLLIQSLRFLEEVGQSPEDLVDLERLAFMLGDGYSVSPDIGLTPIEQRVQFFEAYCDVLRAVSHSKPPVIMVHDLHWADALTIELLTYVLDSGRSFSGTRERSIHSLVVASARHIESTENVRRLAFHPKVQTLDLSGFDVDAVREFFQSSPVLKRLTEITGGNPAELNALIQAPAPCADEVLRQQVMNLSPQAHSLLAALAILGRASSLTRVTKVSGLETSGEALTELQAASLVVMTVQGGEMTLRMARAHYSDKVYAWLEPAERREFHSRAAEFLKGSTGLELQELAIHAIRAEKREIAIEASLEAARALEAAHAFEAAASLLEKSLALATEDQSIDIIERIADLCYRTGQYEQALRHARTVLEVRPKHPTARLAVARLMVLTGDFDQAVELLDVQSCVESTADGPDLMAEYAVVRAEMLYRRAEYDKALKVCETGLYDDSTTCVSLQNVVGKIELAKGHLDRAQAAFERNLELSRRIHNPRLEARSLINLGIVLMEEHELHRASHCLETALSLAERIHDLRESALALENLGVLAHLKGDLGCALDYYHATLAAMKPLGNVHFQARAAYNLAELYLLLRDVDRARSIVEYANQLGSALLPPEVRGCGLLCDSRLALAMGQTEKAQTLLNEARERFEAVGNEARLSEIDLEFARLALRRSDVLQAQALLDQVWASGGSNQRNRAEAALVEAEIESARFGDSVRPLLLAAECFQAIGDTEGLWKVQFELAVSLGRCGDAQGQKQYLEQAIKLEKEVLETVPEELRRNFMDSPERKRLREFLAEMSAETVTHSSSLPLRATLPPPPRRCSSTPSPSNLSKIQEDFRVRFPQLIWRSEAMTLLLAKAERAARSDSQVLILGESGTGKELIAAVIHRLSQRHSRPIVTVNCAALVETLLLDELFGHEKGAFTGALQRRKGRFEMADRGSLFLDEIGDISQKTQVSLLRVLQEQTFERVGGTSPVHVDVRLICATNRDLNALVAEGSFREDLYYRLKGIPLDIPPLRERPEDIVVLAEHFLELAARSVGQSQKHLTKDALELLISHTWPGNVRELENMMQNVTLMIDGPEITAELISEHSELGTKHRGTISSHSTTNPMLSTFREVESPCAPYERFGESTFDTVLDGDLSLRQWQKKMERDYIEKALGRTDWNITQAAKLLGMKRPRLSQLVKEHELTVGERPS